MNILFYTKLSPFTASRVGGAETSIKLLASKLASRGHTVHYLSRRMGQTDVDDEDSINNIGFWRHGAVKGEALSLLIKKINVWLLKKKLIEIIESENIQLIYCFYELQFLEALLELREQGYDFKIVMRMAGLLWYEKSRGNAEMVASFEKVFKSVDCINFIHPYLEEMVFEKFNELDMDVALRNKIVGDIGVSIGYQRRMSYEDLNNQCFKILMATRFSYLQKRYDVLVEALSYITSELAFEVSLRGDGPEREDIVRLIEKRGLSDKVQVRAFVDQQKLWEEMENADILCHSTDYEGLSKIIIEAMAAGLPVLASDVPSINKYITDGENGFLVENESELWAKKLLAVARDKDARVRVSRNAMNFAHLHYNADKNVLKFEEHFEKLLFSR